MDFDQMLRRAMREEIQRIEKEEIENAVETYRKNISRRIGELTQKVSIEIAKHMEIENNQTTITVQYKV